MTYSEKLRDPRWKEKRLEILKRDGNRCVECLKIRDNNDYFSEESEEEVNKTLQIHHKFYNNCEPWGYPNEALVTLCEDHHESEDDFRRSTFKRNCRFDVEEQKEIRKFLLKGNSNKEAWFHFCRLQGKKEPQSIYDIYLKLLKRLQLNG